MLESASFANFTGRIPAQTDERLVSPQSFPHLWKNLWKFGCFGSTYRETLMKTTGFRLTEDLAKHSNLL